MKYSKKLLVVLFGIGFFFFGGVQAFGQEWSAEQQEVLKMEVTYWDLLKEGNLKGYMELWHKDVIAWPNWAPNPIGREGLEKGTIPWYKFVRSYDLTTLATKKVTIYTEILLSCEYCVEQNFLPRAHLRGIYNRHGNH